MEDPQVFPSASAAGVSAQPSSAPVPPTQSASSGSSCAKCGGTGPASSFSSSHVIAVGNVTAAFPNLSVEKEFAQILSRSDFKGMTDRQTMYAVLSRPEHRYLARRICWELTVYGGGSSPTYVLVPEEPGDAILLVDTLQRPPRAQEVDVVAGVITGIAPPTMCNAQQLPIVRFYQLYSFVVRSMVEAIRKKSERSSAEEFERAGEELFQRLMGMASNGTGLTRALTHAALHYAGLYELVADKLVENSALTEVHVRSSQLSTDRADIYLRFTKRDTGFHETCCFGVDVGGPFPYLEERLHPCFEGTMA